MTGQAASWVFVSRPVSDAGRDDAVLPYACTFGGSGKTAKTASRNRAVAVRRSPMPLSRPVRRLDSGPRAPRNHYFNSLGRPQIDVPAQA